MVYEAVSRLNSLVWGAPTLVLILGTGLTYSIKTGFLQIRKLPLSLRTVAGSLRGKPENGVSPFQAVCTALGATVGTGNIAGVAGAIAMGGPGAVFWMWIAAILGMMVKYAEVVLAHLTRVKTARGDYLGGPMYYIRDALGRAGPAMAVLYCIFGLLAAAGVGNAIQISTAVAGVHQALRSFRLPEPGWLNPVLGFILGALVAVTLIGGAKRIGSAAELLIPAAALGYIALSLGAIWLHRDRLPGALEAIFVGAFSPRAFTGGAVGTAFAAMRTGVSRGVFTNEAGLGAASIAHAGAATGNAAQQGLFGFFEVFADTLVICSMTALVILTAPIDIPFGASAGAELTAAAFSCTYGPWITAFLALSIALFSFATVLGWGLYGLRFAEFLFGSRVRPWFNGLHAAMVVLGAMASPRLLWALAEITNGLMAVPNLLALLKLRDRVTAETQRYFRQTPLTNPKNVVK